MEIAGLKYKTTNIGDEIQSLAADRLVGVINKRFDREKLAKYEGDKAFNIILNGWYSHDFKSSFPPSELFNPVFYSFHIYKGRKNKSYFTNKECVSYLKKHEPIGCRDEATKNLLKKKGIDSFYSKCLTMTFPRRISTPLKQKIFFVDADFVKNILPNSLKNIENESISHVEKIKGNKFEFANNLLKKYKNEATLVITTRLHCALPCVALGIPVILFHNPNDRRMDTVKGIGLKIYKDRANYPKILNFILNYLGLLEPIKNWHRNIYLKKLVNNNSINWNPDILNIESIKEEIIGGLNKMIEQKFT